MEAILEIHLFVNIAIICGLGYSGQCLLIEPSIFLKTVEERNKFLDGIYGLRSKIKGRGLPWTGELLIKELTVFLSPHNPAPRVRVKCVISRKLLIKLYKDELNKVYNSAL